MRQAADSSRAPEAGRIGYFKSEWWGRGVGVQCSEWLGYAYRGPKIAPTNDKVYRELSTSPHISTATDLPYMKRKVLGWYINGHEASLQAICSH
jgi:hypothetical protein